MTSMVQLESVTHTVEYQDPVLLFHHLMGGRPGGLLLESAEIDSKRHLNSFLLVKRAVEIRCVGNRVTVTAITENGARLVNCLALRFDVQVNQEPDEKTFGEFSVKFAPAESTLDEDQRLVAPGVLEPIREIRKIVNVNSTVNEALFIGGLFSYDLVECFESLPELAGAGDCPNYVFYVAEQLLHLDHQKRSGQLIGSYFYSQEHRGGRTVLEAELADVAGKCRHLNLVDLPPTMPSNDEYVANKSDEEFASIVVRLKAHILKGDVFQIVPSRFFRMKCPSPLRAYRQLRKLNPSPYMFFMSDPEFILFGASPEMALRFSASDRTVEVCPIAGTRRRGKNSDGSINPDLDSRIELELRTDSKEMAEHLMLVDLARNDLARICEAGTRHVGQLLKVDRYSHVMHLVSRVVGRLRNGLDALHAWQACMNMGTLTGAPKVRAMQLIRELEGVRRDSYGGAIGYLLGNGDMETCIVIRSALVIDGMAKIQAGAGVVYDSVPELETEETLNKAAAVLAAIRQASQSNGDR